MSVSLSAQTLLNNNARAGATQAPVMADLEPFYHGVASGDPTTDGVIIWTRLTPDAPGTYSVDWEMSTDTMFTTIAASGTFSTDASRDYTVKVDVNGLAAGQTYYYRFFESGRRSITGRTKTLPTGSVSQLRFGVASCNNYQGGFFSAFGRLSERNDLDAIIHLGDFIYEYADGEYGSAPGRNILPLNEILDISDYRMRYGYYRLDDDLRRAMQQHPFIFVWDDHEVANDAWENGAQNHNAGEGLYATRKAEATQAYFEWCPIRDNGTQRIYRDFEFGDLMHLSMLDTRHDSRTIQVDSFTQPNINDPSRFLLGNTQRTWLENELTSTSATWNVIGNQILFAPLLLDNYEPVYPGVRDIFLDIWDGYPYERQVLFDYIDNNNIDNVVFLTGDIHISLGFDVTLDPDNAAAYDPATGAGSKAVEFVTPSISSDNFDEVLGAALAAALEGSFGGENPHNKLRDFDQHGYLVFDVLPSKVQADYYMVDGGVQAPSTTETYFGGVFSNVGTNHLQTASGEAAGKPVQEIPAPDPTVVVSNNQAPENVVVLSVHPNPASTFAFVNYATLENGDVNINLIDSQGRLVKELLRENQAASNYGFWFDLQGVNSGMYFIQINLSGVNTTMPIQIIND